MSESDEYAIDAARFTDALREFCEWIRDSNDLILEDEERMKKTDLIHKLKPLQGISDDELVPLLVRVFPAYSLSHLVLANA